jgi:hypothetical protein
LGNGKSGFIQGLGMKGLGWWMEGVGFWLWDLMAWEGKIGKCF